MRVYVVRKWLLWERIRSVCQNITQVSLSTVQRAFRAKYAKDPPTDKIIHVFINNLLKLGVRASRNQVVAH
jgi:hypothetical protein